MTRTNKETAATRPIGADLDALAQLVAQRRPHSSGYKGEMTDATNLNRKLDLFDEHWQPKIVAQVNDYDVRIVKVKGEFVWHKHDHTDDFFLVLKGHLTIQLRDRNVEPHCKLRRTNGMQRTSLCAAADAGRYAPL